MNRYIYTKLLAAATTLLFNFLDERNRVIFIANENNPSDRSSLNVKKKGRGREREKRQTLTSRFQEKKLPIPVRD